MSSCQSVGNSRQPKCLRPKYIMLLSEFFNIGDGTRFKEIEVFWPHLKAYRPTKDNVAGRGERKKKKR